MICNLAFSYYLFIRLNTRTKSFSKENIFLFQNVNLIIFQLHILEKFSRGRLVADRCPHCVCLINIINSACHSACFSFYAQQQWTFLYDFIRDGLLVYVLINNFSIFSVNGDKQLVNCHNFTRQEVSKWLELLRTQAGNHDGTRLRKFWHTENPSIQGPWTPFTFRDPAMNLVQFPNEELSKAFCPEKSATEELLELFTKQQKDISELDNKRAE